MEKSNSLLMGQMLRRRYTLALSIIAFLVLLSQGMIQFTIYSQQDDSRIINIAGRQRMLSQRINKAAFGLYISSETNDQGRYLKELETSLELWERSHKGLLNGDEELGLPGKNSEKIIEMFKVINGQHQAMVNAATSIETRASAPAYDRETLLASIRVIQDNETAFLKGMDAIVFQYDLESKQKITYIKTLEIIILAVTFIALSMEVLFIFRPAQRQIEDAMVEIETSQKNMERLFETAPAAMFLLNAADFSVTKLNHLAQEIFNVTPENSSDLDFKKMLELQQGDVKDLMAQLAAGVSIENAEMVLNTPDNLSLVVLLSSNLIKYDDKNTILMGLSDITRLKEAEEVLKRYATIDDMTGLLNKRSGMLVLGNSFDRALSGEGPLSVCFMDIDGLKAVNDTYGHEEGDFYIKTIAHVIRSSVNIRDTVFRYGGDEIIVILGGCSRIDAQAVISRIAENLRDTSERSGKPYPMHLSIGIAQCGEVPSDTPEGLLTRADQAMYENKRHYKSMVSSQSGTHEFTLLGNQANDCYAKLMP